VTPALPKVIYADRVSELTGLSERALKRRREQRKEPLSFPMGRRAAYLESDVIAFIEKQRAEGARRVEDWIARHLNDAPPLDAQQRELICQLLASGSTGQTSAAG
jgi:predicted DNA-binding transcriptional regulator AlpA